MSHGLPQDYNKALELWHGAGNLGHADAYIYIYDVAMLMRLWLATELCLLLHVYDNVPITFVTTARSQEAEI